MHKKQVDAAAPSEYVPGSQLLHKELELLLAKVPGVQLLQNVDAGRDENLPGLQIAHVELLGAPDVLEKEPAGQLMHDELPPSGMAANLPGSQALHTDLPSAGEKRPRGQSRHHKTEVAPVTLENFPAAHAEQEELARGLAAYVPMPQLTQAEDPCELEKLPALQSMHKEMDVAPTRPEYFPKSHAAHDELPDALTAYHPAEHRVHVEEPGAFEKLPGPQSMHQDADAAPAISE